MPDAYTVEDYLSLIADGEAHLLGSALAIIADSILYVPVCRTSDFEGLDGQKSIWVPTELFADRSAISAFSSEEYLLNWAAGRFQCFPVMGAELALSLPPDRWLLINPGIANALELSPDHVAELAAFALPAPEREATAVGALEDAESEGSTELGDFTVKAQAAEILRQFSEAREAYYLRAKIGSEVEAYIGLYCDGMDSEMRFRLIAELAELARGNFGFAGAIEVFDDLSTASSASWDLFNSVAPFYVRDALDEEQVVFSEYAHKPGLSDDIETLTVETKAWTPFSALKAGRDRFLQVLRSRRTNGHSEGPA